MVFGRFGFKAHRRVSPKKPFLVFSRQHQQALGHNPPCGLEREDVLARYHVRYVQLIGVLHLHRFYQVALDRVKSDYAAWNVLGKINRTRSWVGKYQVLCRRCTVRHCFGTIVVQRCGVHHNVGVVARIDRAGLLIARLNVIQIGVQQGSNDLRRAAGFGKHILQDVAAGIVGERKTATCNNPVDRDRSALDIAGDGAAGTIFGLVQLPTGGCYRRTRNGRHD